ncbi:MAG: beta-lactamase family protein [Acidibacter sp.]|nr:beta-lactamase family protein [Acidibacter sp.]
MRWIWGLLKSLLALVVLVAIVLPTVIWIADPTVLRNLMFGQPLDEPASVHLAKPQTRVAGAAQVGDIPTGESTTLAAKRLAAAEALASKTSSVALLVWHRGALRYEKYWPPFDATTRTNPNSMHKAVLALAIGAAVTDGVIPSLDSKASRWLTEWQGDARRDVTVEDLLRMHSGIELPRFGTWKATKLLLGSDLPGAVLSLGYSRAPGTYFEYNNASSQLLLLLVERATGQRYADYLASRLWQPLGAAEAALWMDREGGVPRGFCCLFASARDWLRVGLLLAADGKVGERQLIASEWVQAMKTPSSTNPNFGMHLWLGSPPTKERKHNDYSVKAFHSEKFLAADIYYIVGFGGQRVYVVPSRDLIVVRTGVSQLDWDDAPLINTIIRAADEGASS